jgi:hypothetical protein
VKLHIDEEWLRRKIEEVGDPPACPACGAMAGACKDYPNCPGAAPADPKFVQVLERKT